MTLRLLRKELLQYKNPKRAVHATYFFKTAPGQYGYGDVFYGLKVGDTRAVAKKFSNTSAPVLKQLLWSKFHEERLLALLILEIQYKKAVKMEDSQTQKVVFTFLMKNRERINNWDLVDTIASGTIGNFLFHHPKEQKILNQLIRSKILWDRRIAMIATHFFICEGKFDLTLKFSKVLLNEKEDLMHKASGWMLRELGKRDIKTLKLFLEHHAAQMPRTMLRYSIEKFPAAVRRRYLNQT